MINDMNELDKKWAEGIAELKALIEEEKANLESRFSEAELRVARNSSRFQSVEEAIRQAETGIDMLLDQWENICALNDYLDSGEWQADFEAEERGEISKLIPRGVLSEDGLYNALDRLQDLLGQMASIVDHVVIPEEGDE
jgi:predicted nuclease with TOPRIM domain